MWTPEQTRQYHARYQAEHKERIAAKKRAYYLANRAKFKEKAKKQYEANPQKAIDRAARWSKEHPEAVREIRAKRARANPEERRQACKRHREAHPEFHRKRLAQWRKQNPLLVRLYGANRRARIKGSGGQITAEQIAALYAKQRGRCAACRKALKGQYQLDHVMPLALGGEHTIENAQILCSRCNQSKHAMHPDAWAARTGRLFV